GRELRRCILELLSRQGSPAELLGNDSIPGGIDALHDMGLAALLVDHCRVELPDHLVLVKLLNRLKIFERVVHVAVRRRVEHVLSHKSSSRGSRKGCRQREKQSPPSVLSRRGLSHRSRFPLKGWAGSERAPHRGALSQNGDRRDRSAVVRFWSAVEVVVALV